MPLNPAFLGKPFTWDGEPLTRYEDGEVVIWLDFETQTPRYAWLRHGALQIPTQVVREKTADDLVDLMNDLVATERTLCSGCGMPVTTKSQLYYRQGEYYCYPCWVEHRSRYPDRCMKCGQPRDRCSC